MTNVTVTPTVPGAKVGAAALAGAVAGTRSAPPAAVAAKAVAGAVGDVSVIHGPAAGIGVAAPAPIRVGPPPAAYTTNLCPNGSFETSLTGWQSVLGATLARTSQDSVAGQYSMQVITPGALAGEGCYGPQVFTGQGAQGSIAASFSGETGTLIISAVTNPDGIIQQQQTIHLTPAWQRVTFTGLPWTPTDQVYILVQTAGSAQALNFLMDAVQYEPESPATPYIDGSFPGCTWLGTPFASASVLQGQFSISLSGGFNFEGSINLDLMGEIFVASPAACLISAGGSITAVTASPVAAFDDFALFELTDPDPAMTYTGWNTAYLLSGQSDYTRPWAIFYPPLDYPASDGTLMWPRAAFMGMGLEFVGVPAGVAQNLTSAQVEMVPLNGPTGLDYTPGPQVFDTPRALHLIVKPARLNYSTNPNFAVSLAGWNVFGGASAVQDSARQYGVFGGYDGVAYEGGTYSMAVTAASATAGVSITIPELIAGDIYTASIYVLDRSGQLTDLRLLVSGESGGVPGADGVTPLLTLFPGSYPVAGWVRAQLTFTAPGSTVTLALAPLLTAAGTWPVTFNLAASLIEAGEITDFYFDGSLGNPDYLWEGTPGLSRSYYYPNYLAGQGVLNDILASHTPMSISAATAVYLTPPTQ